MAKLIPPSADASRRAAYYLYFIRAIAPFQVLRSLVSFDSCDRSVIQYNNQNICLSIKSVGVGVASRREARRSRSAMP
ncbi:MAG: hypothetical protein ACYT04_23365 [Nostoc sp.]